MKPINIRDCRSAVFGSQDLCDYKVLDNIVRSQSIYLKLNTIALNIMVFSGQWLYLANSIGSPRRDFPNNYSEVGQDLLGAPQTSFLVSR